MKFKRASGLTKTCMETHCGSKVILAGALKRKKMKKIKTRIRKRKRPRKKLPPPLKMRIRRNHSETL